MSAVADLDGVAGAIAADSCGDQDDTLADFSNDGPAVDVAAPGTCVVSTAVGGGYIVLSGTSMSTAHVSGAAVLLAAKEKPMGRAGVLALRAAIVATGSDAWVDDGGTGEPDGVKEPLLDVSVADYQVGLPASATVVCSGGGVPSAGLIYRRRLERRASPFRRLRRRTRHHPGSDRDALPPRPRRHPRPDGLLRGQHN